MRDLFSKPVKRLDHDRAYVAVAIGLFLTSISILSHWNTTTYALSGLGLATENGMAILLLVGSASAIFGFLSGTSFFRSKTDIRDCYSIAKWSLVSISIGLLVYSFGMLTTGGLDWPPTFPLEILVGLAVGADLKAIDFHYGREMINTEPRPVATKTVTSTAALMSIFIDIRDI